MVVSCTCVVYIMLFAPWAVCLGLSLEDFTSAERPVAQSAPTEIDSGFGNGIQFGTGSLCPDATETLPSGVAKCHFCCSLDIGATSVQRLCSAVLVV